MLMKHPAIRRVLAALLASGLLLLCACGSNDTPAGDTEDTPGSTSAAPADEEYDYPSLDLKNETVTILNEAQGYGFYGTIDLEEATGEKVDDAVFGRNRDLEERFHFKLAVNEEYSYNAAVEAMNTSVLSQDDLYDAAFIRDSYLQTSLTEGYLIDLSTLDGFRFEEDWWDPTTTEAAIGGKVFYGFTDISLVGFEGTTCLFFNENMLEDLNMEAPYQLVRDGKWTLDKLGEYLKAGANLNGADTFAWKADGSATYGMMSWHECPTALLVGSNVEYLTVNEDGVPELAAKGEHFHEAADKVIRLLATDGEYLELNVNQGPDHYEIAFQNRRSLMTLAQIKAANKFRAMDDGYGILPIPKYDESQESYRNNRAYSYLMVMPVTNANANDVSYVLDAMSYQTDREILPIFYGERISLKGLRNDDSIEMLDIISNSRYFDIGMCYGWRNTVMNAVNGSVNAKNNQVASAIAGIEESLKASIDSIMAKLEDNE